MSMKEGTLDKIVGVAIMEMLVLLSGIFLGANVFPVERKVLIADYKERISPIPKLNGDIYTVTYVKKMEDLINHYKSLAEKYQTLYYLHTFKKPRHVIDGNDRIDDYFSNWRWQVYEGRIYCFCDSTWDTEGLRVHKFYPYSQFKNELKSK